MLKAREPRLFAAFTITLASALREIMVQNYAVFDKFTGDGILAFFPDFFSGEDAGYRALHAAEQCHLAFAKHYENHRSTFSSVMLDTGLGIGIDYGAIHIVQIGGEFTVVGAPVVYACRMAGAEAGHTYVNQSAYDQLFSRYAAFDFIRTDIMIKHEGRTLAYAARPNGKLFSPKLPGWEVAASS
jgi:class 3 adenylate cyclase